MRGRHHADRHITEHRCATLVEGVTDRDALRLEHRDQLEHSRDRQAGFPGDAHDVFGVVEMAVGQQDLRCTFKRLGAAFVGQHRVARQPWINEDDLVRDLEAKAAVA